MARDNQDLTKGPLARKILFFSAPLIVSNLLQVLFNVADIAVVGRFAGASALGSVGSTTILVTMFTSFLIGVSGGINVLTALYLGSGDRKGVRETVHSAFLFSILTGLTLLLIGAIFSKGILELLNTKPELIDGAVLYIRIYFLGMTATMVYNFGSAILRAVGDTKRPLYYLFGAGVVNVILNLLFVIGFHLDVAGVAMATVISQCISAGLVLRCLIKEKGAIRLEIRQLHIHKDKFLGILKIGLPAGVQGIIFSLSNVVIQSSINSFGAVTVAGNSAAANIESFVYFAMNAFHQATISFTGQNMGAGNYKRINKIVITGEICVTVVGLVLGNLVVFFGHPLLSIYSSSSKVIAAGMVRLKVVSVTYALCGMMDVMVGALRGIGYSIMPMIVSMIGACGLRLVWLATIFQIPKYHTVHMIYVSYPITWAITFFAHICCFIWAKRCVEKKAGVLK